MRLRLTPETQKTRFLEDAERIRAKRSPNFSIGDHLLMLMKRCEALEARLAAIEPLSSEPSS